MKLKLLIWIFVITASFSFNVIAIDENDMSNELCISSFNRANNNALGAGETGCVDNANAWVEKEAVAGEYSISSNTLKFDATSDAIGDNVSIDMYVVNGSIFRFYDIDMSGFGGPGNLGLGRFYDSEGTVCYSLRVDHSGSQWDFVEYGGSNYFAFLAQTIINVSFIFTFNGSTSGAVNVTFMNSINNFTRDLENNCNNISKLETMGAVEAIGGSATLNNLTVINGTIPDITPPEITFYNMTSEGGEGCTNWNTDKNNACFTSDTTPTVFIRTNTIANCAIGGEDLNYTALGTNRTCSGSGSMEHTCTLIAQDELTEETSFVYIGCQTLNGIENLTSSSGALSISIQSSDLETEARNVIETGIQHALTSDYTIYTDQKIYARNSANSQFVTTFDKVVKWMSKIWAFNILTGNETFDSNLFNITPTLYILEMRNITSITINQTVYDLITDTK